MSVASRHQPIQQPSQAYTTCLHVDHFNEGSRVPPALPKPKIPREISRGEAAGIGVASLTAAVIVTGLVSRFLRQRHRRCCTKSQNGFTVAVGAADFRAEKDGGPESQVSEQGVEKEPVELSVRVPVPELSSS